MTNHSVFCWYWIIVGVHHLNIYPAGNCPISFSQPPFSSRWFPLYCLVGYVILLWRVTLKWSLYLYIFVQMLQKIHCSYLLVAKSSYLEDEKNLWRMIFGDFQSHCIWALPMLEESNHQKQIQVESDLLIFLSGSPTALCNLVKFHRDLTRPKIPKGSFWKGNSPLFLGNLGAWNILIWPDFMPLDIWAVFQGPWLVVVYRGVDYWLIWGLYIIRVLNVAHLKTQTMSFLQNLVGLVRKNEQPAYHLLKWSTMFV